MYVRRKLNKTGTVSIQGISKRTGTYRVLRSFGTGHTEQELVRMEEHARQFIIAQQGFVGDLFSESKNKVGCPSAKNRKYIKTVFF